MIHTDGKPTIASGAEVGRVAKPKRSWTLQDLQAERREILAALERNGNEIALVLWDGEGA